MAAERLRRLARGELSRPEPERKPERLGQSTIARPEGLVLWVLAEKSSEIGPAPALAQEVSRRLGLPLHVLATPLSDTPLVPSVENAVIHQLAPADSEGSARRFLDHWRPDAALVFGTPPRGQLLNEAATRRIPLFGAASDRNSITSQRRLPSYLKHFHTFFAASASEATLLRPALKAAETVIEIAGPLTDTVNAPPCNEAECDDLAKLLGGRPVWLAADVDGIEIDIAEAAHRKAFRSAHRLLLVLVPRPNCDAAEIVERFERDGWRVARRSTMAEPDPEIQIYIADTENELGFWYRLAPACFIGGSILRQGIPTDPFAPAALGSAVLHGPNTGPNPSRFERLAENNASLPVRNADELAEAVVTLLAPDKAASLAQAGWATVTESAHVIECIADVMEEVLGENDGVS